VSDITLIDRAFHHKDKESDTIWRIQVFQFGETEELSITHGRMSGRLRTIFPIAKTQYASRLEEALARISEKEGEGYHRIPLGAVEASSPRQHTNTHTGSPVHPTQEPTVRSKKQVRPLDGGILPRTDPSEWFF
jgi:hypothetical protein